MKKLFFFIVLLVMGSSTHPAFSATPFPAPAAFDLEGSNITLTVQVETRALGTIGMALNPNPAPVAGTVQIDQLNQVSGVFSGAFKDISASTTATADQLGLSTLVTLTLNSSSVAGVFVWAKNKVIFDLEDLQATLTVGSQSVQVPLYGTYLPATYEDHPDGGVLRIEAEINESVESLGYKFTVQAAVNLIGILQTPVTANLWVELKTDRSAYVVGEHVKLSAALGKSGSTPAVDLYLVLYAPDGKYYFAPDYTTAAVPLLSGWQPDKDFYIPPIVVYDITTPATLPPVGVVGDYQFMAAFIKSGTTELVGDVTIAPFSLSQTAPQTYDGMWRGSAESLESSLECAGFADVWFEVKDSRITGEANEIKMEDADGYLVTGTVKTDGGIADGIILEEFGLDYIPVGVLKGAFSGDTASGTWQDAYGCYGTFSLTRSEY